MAQNDTQLNGSDIWNLTEDKGYILGRSRSHAAAGRLNLQFYLWKDVLGYNIHPTIAASLPENAAIADVATGSGIWLIDLSRQHPKAQLDGFDYNMNQVPHQKLLPKNVRMRYLNLLEDIPADLVGKYDVVHTRLLVVVVENSDPRPVIRNLQKLLKPGGWVQWDELDTVNMKIIKAEPDVPTPALQQVFDWSYGGGRRNWTVRLGEYMAEEGFVNSETHFVGDPPELARAFNDQHLLTVEEFAQGLDGLGKKEDAARYFQIIEKAYEESTTGASICMPRVVCIAQKAS